MKLSNRPYKGTRDFFPEKKRELNYIFEKLSTIAESFGYEDYDGPILEEVELYLAKSGEELINEQIYSFYDRGKRHVAIRPEMTPTLARMVSQIHRERQKPFRWYSIPVLMRYERPQRGRFREHFQFNCDIFGAPDGLGEIEIINLLITLLKSFGATSADFKIYVNDRRFLDAFFRSVLKLNDDQSYKLYKIIDRSKKIGNDELHKSLDELALSNNQITVFFEYLSLKTISDLNKFSTSLGISNCVEQLNSFFTHMERLSYSDCIQYDPCIVRGLDYYTGIVFECFDLHPDNNRAICGGGSYANLLQIFNEPELPGVGFGLGDVTLTDFLRSHNLLPDFRYPKNHIFLAPLENDTVESVQIFAHNLRIKGIKCVTALAPVKIKKGFSMAENLGAKFICFLGQDEVNSQKISLKNLITKKEFNFAINDLIPISKVILNDNSRNS